ncbi:MAG TPA: SIR2 family protein [Thermoanaerobaculia bacterium]|jgi:hypothetical protein
MRASPLNVIILDDRSRFALHAWRYLSRSVGFGIGDVPSDGEARSQPGETDDLSDMKRPWRLSTPAGDAVIWWVRVRKAGTPEEPGPWVDELDSALKATEKERRVFLVDVRGEPTGPPGGFWRLALPILADLGAPPDPKDVWLMSSYEVGIRRFDSPKGSLPFDIRPKSTETLQELAERIWPTRSDQAVVKKAAVRSRRTTVHFLVSGAGFELKSRSFPSINPVGIPPTEKLLEAAYRAAVWEANKKAGAGAKPRAGLARTPFPLPPFVEAIREYRELVSGAALDGLDQLWDGLLEVVLDREKSKNKGEFRPNVRKADMLAAEESARESFRAAFLGDDWGQLTQVLDAAALPWSVWLTTNYTHFVDRAVALQKGQTEGARPVPPWRILSIATEAEHLLRRMFFDERHSHKRSSVERFIFKLHGDLAHLSTMAIAGQDKELFSLITHTVDSLHWLYEAAQTWMETLLSTKGKARVDRVHWHIVGHGLKDQALLKTLERVISSTSQFKIHHDFLFIQPNAKSEIQNVDLNWAKRSRIRWHLQPYGADEWMAMMRKFCRVQGRMWTLEDGDLLEAVRRSVGSGV